MKSCVLLVCSAFFAHAKNPLSKTQEASVGAHKRGQNISYVCLGNVCRSAGAHIFAHALTVGINEYTECDTHLDSFAQLESVAEGAQAKEFQRIAMDDPKKQQAYIDEIQKTLGRSLGEDEKQDFKNALLAQKEAHRVSFLKKDSGETKLRPNTTVFVPIHELVGLTEEHIRDRVGHRPDVVVKTMAEEQIIDDGAWMTTQLLETFMLRKVLEAYPGKYERKEGPFSKDKDLVNLDNMLGEYKRLGGYEKLAETDVPKTLTAEEVGFIYHDLTKPALKQVVAEFGEAFGYNDGGFLIKDGLYTKRIFPRPGFFKDRKALIELLRNDGNDDIADGIENLVNEKVVPAYFKMSLQMLDVALKTLPKCNHA